MKIEIVKSLIDSQFPAFSNLQVRDIECSGHDNYTFRLGDDFSIRIPRDKKYEKSIIHESIYLNKIQSGLSFQVPFQIEFGKPGEYFNLHWSINKWIDGKSLDCYKKENLDLINIAKNVSNFLNELHQIDTKDGIVPSRDNFYRGGNLTAYNDEMINALSKIDDKSYRDKIEKVWIDALNVDTSGTEVWIHGDLAVGNILLEDGKINGIIDFGQMAVGEFSCDLVIAWNFFEGKSCDLFLFNIKNITNNHILKAKAWAIWKAICWPVGTRSKGDIVVRNILNF